MTEKPLKVRFIKSSNNIQSCPKDNLPEFAFIGRSNVGKSSLINMLSGIKDLAKTSQRPGKTQLINHFMVDEKWFMVDLPGYGYAKTSKELRAQFDVIIKSYILQRTTLQCLFVLIDSRLEPQQKDLDFIEFLGENSVPFVIVFTKADKQSINKTESNISVFKKTLLKNWESLPDIFVTSSLTHIGRKEILNFIDNIVNQ